MLVCIHSKYILRTTHFVRAYIHKRSILFLKDLSLYTFLLGQSRQIFSKRIVTSLLINHLALKIFVAIISVKDAKEHKVVSLVGVIRKPLDVNEWPFWTDTMSTLDGSKLVVNVGKIRTVPSSTTGAVPQDIIMLDDKGAINIKWIHEMEFVYD